MVELVLRLLLLLVKIWILQKFIAKLMLLRQELPKLCRLSIVTMPKSVRELSV
jgi:hypothetical protein